MREVIFLLVLHDFRDICSKKSSVISSICTLSVVQDIRRKIKKKNLLFYKNGLCIVQNKKYILNLKIYCHLLQKAKQEVRFNLNMFKRVSDPQGIPNYFLTDPWRNQSLFFINSKFFCWNCKCLKTTDLDHFNNSYSIPI